ncbi:MAG: hypothetical protein H0U20_10080 [Thermoleophilaceae bacterium]|jgi:lipopolysaccharide export LptBFGC system permease protein LptF|nr:hypothetical protein [Thermoleophilaceae bacterium]
MRLLLCFAVFIATMVALHLAFDLERLGDWGYTGLGIAVGLLVTLLDRDGFYGPSSERPVAP